MATVYLRGIPEHVVREAKAAAARRGVTLAVFVSEALAQSLGVDAVGSEDAGDLRAEMAWYQTHKRKLLPRYRDQYLAIVNRKVVDHDKDFGALARRVFKRLGVRPIFMPKCVDGDRVVNLPSPRV
ncbi:MAG: DUF5678 domain-containing protein, partial [Armatimonadota bacterium]